MHTNNITSKLDFSPLVTVILTLLSSLLTWIKTQTQQIYHMVWHYKPHWKVLVESSYQKENNPTPLLSQGIQTMIKLFWLRLIDPLLSPVWFIPFFFFFAGKHFPHPANLFKHFQASRMQTGLSDQAKLPKRPLIVYGAEADERQAGGGEEEDES